MRSILRNAAVLVFILALATPPTGVYSAETGAATPEALVERLEAAAASGDIVELMRCLEPESRIQFTAFMTLMPLMAVGFAAMGAEMGEGMAEAAGAEGADVQETAGAEIDEMVTGFQALLERHGLPDLLSEDDDVDFDDAFANIDHGAYLADLFAFLAETFPDESEDSAGELFFGEGVTITGLEVDGDRATAWAEDEEIVMVKVDGRWYVHLPDFADDGMFGSDEFSADYGSDLPSLEGTTPLPIPADTPSDLQPLAASCFEGDMEACRDVYFQAAIGSDIENWGLLCGGRLSSPPPMWCDSLDTGSR